MSHRSILFCFSLVLSVVLTNGLSAQAVSSQSSKQRSAQQFDRWNQRFFRPGWTGGLQIGLLPTFFKDEVHAELPPVSLRVGYQFAPVFSLELEAGRSVSRTTALDYNSRKELPIRNAFSLVALRPTVHLALGERSDAYGGLILGYQHNRIETLQPQTKGNEAPVFYPREGFTMTGFLGVDYALTSRLRVNAELGYGLSLISTGIRYRLP